MKVSFITMHCVQNYGSQLQTYATQELFKEYFDDVEIIDYRRSDTYGEGLRNLYAKGNLLKLLTIEPTIIKWKKVFGDFQKKYLNLTKNTYKKNEDFEKNPISCDVLFTGSDQVWNTGWNNGIIEPYYLSFGTEKPKYAFSSSFGKDKLADDEIDILRNRLSTFKRISVRESSGKDIIEKQLKLQSEVIIDPTLIYDGNFWRKLKSENRIKNNYILIYSLRKNKELDKYAKEISRITKYPLYRFCTRYDQILRTGRKIVIPKIEDFITYIDGASYVITDSFHATAFSTNLHTEVIPIYPEKYSGRIRSFLNLVKNERANPKNFNDYSVINTKTDFELTDKILNEEREKAKNYLKSIVKELKSETR